MRTIYFPLLGLCTCSARGSVGQRGFLPSPSQRRGQSEAAKGPWLLNVLCFSLQPAGFKPSIVRLPVTKESQRRPQPGFPKVFFFLQLELTIPWPKPPSCLFLSLRTTVSFNRGRVLPNLKVRFPSPSSSTPTPRARELEKKKTDYLASRTKPL